MLIEKDEFAGSPVSCHLGVGDTVKVKATGQVGQITGFQHGMWQVRLVEGHTIPCADGALERKEMLLG